MQPLHHWLVNLIVTIETINLSWLVGWSSGEGSGLWPDTLGPDVDRALTESTHSCSTSVRFLNNNFNGNSLQTPTEIDQTEFLNILCQQKSSQTYNYKDMCVFVSVSQSACFLKISHLCTIVSFLVFKALPSLPDHLTRWCLAFFLLVFLNLFRLNFVIWACLLDWTDLLWWTNVAFCDSHLINYASFWKSPIYSHVACWITVVYVKTKKRGNVPNVSKTGSELLLRGWDWEV